MVSASDISPSRGENTEELTNQTTALVDSGRWKLWDNGKGLERQFRFKTFKATWVCMKYVICTSCPVSHKGILLSINVSAQAEKIR